MQLSPVYLVLLVGLAALMFQLHSALKRELNEDDALQQNLVAVIDRQRTTAFNAFVAAVGLEGMIRNCLQTPTSDPEWEPRSETCEANLYEVAVRIYLPLAKCVEIRASRTSHVAWLKRGKTVSLASCVTGVVAAVSCAISVSTEWAWTTWLTIALLGIFVLEVACSLILWYMADGRQSALADVRRDRGRRL
jgi:hypothetical protein